MTSLCKYCEAAVDWHIDHTFTKEQRTDLPFHDSIDAFLESRKQCQLCALILQEYSEVSTFKSLLQSNNHRARFKFSMLKMANGFSRFWPTSIYNDNDRGREALNVTLDETKGWMTSSQGKGYARSKAKNSICQLTYISVEDRFGCRAIWRQKDPSFEDRLTVVQEWIQECDAVHTKCKDLTIGLPKRLIDVGQEGGRDPKLIYTTNLDTSAHRIKYATLSHCWGDPAKSIPPLKTTQGTEKEFLNTISWKQLPPNFRDAITITRKVGIPYIWVDSLCIQQDNQKEWELESAKMAAIYRGTYVNLAASFSPHCQGGMIHNVSIPSYSQDWRLKQLEEIRKGDWFNICKEFENELQSERRNSHVILPRISQNHSTIIVMFRFGFAERYYCDYRRENLIWDNRLNRPDPRDPLYTRGWVLQEQVLSSRTVRFTRDQMRWECRHTIQSEDGTLAKPYTTYLDPEGVTQFSFQNPKESTRIWDSWFCDILNRDFTFHDDRPAAMAGLVEFYKEKTQFSPLLAEWRETLVRDLTWDADRQKMTIPPSERSPFPSWSWLSIPPLTNVFYEPVPIGESDEIKTEVEILEASVHWEGPPFTSKFSRSKLVVLGRVMPVRELEVEIPSHDSNLPYEIAFLKNWVSREAFDYITQNENLEHVMLLHLMQRITFGSIFRKRTERVVEDLLLIIIPVSLNLDPLVCYRLGRVFNHCSNFDERSPNLIPSIFTRGRTRVVELL